MATLALEKTKAEKLLGTVKTSNEKVAAYFPRIKRSLWIKLTNFKENLEKLSDEITDLENFTLDTNLNKATVAMTMEEYEKRFINILDKKFEYELLKAEYDSKKKTFEEYFGKSEVAL